MGLQSKMADLGRLHEIVRAFSIAGFGDIFKKMGLEAEAERTGRIMGWKYAEDIAHLERPQRIRKLFEVLGPTFIKLGQILATRPDPQTSRDKPLHARLATLRMGMPQFYLFPPMEGAT